MLKTNPLDYAASVGRVRALEKFLIKREVFEEAINLSLLEALRLIVEASLYGDDLLHIKNSSDLERVLQGELKKLKKLIKSLLIEKDLFYLMELDSVAGVQKTILAHQGDFLADYLKYVVDMHNIKTFLRLKILNSPLEQLKTKIIYEGFVKKEVFFEFYNKELTAFLNKLEYVHKRDVVFSYASFLKEGTENIEAKKSFVSLEKAVDDFLMEALKPAKYIAFGPEAVIAYYFAKLNEMKLIRLVILAKINNVPLDLIKQRLNGVYA